MSKLWLSYGGRQENGPEGGVMHTDYVNPAIRQLRDQQVRFAPREKRLEQVRRPSGCWANWTLRGRTPTNISATGSPTIRPESYPDLKLTGREASHDLRLFVEDLSDVGRRAGRGGGRAGADGRGVGQAVQRLDQDDFPLAAAGAGQPAVRVGRPQAGRVPAELGRPVRRAEPGAGAPRRRSSAS